MTWVNKKLFKDIFTGAFVKLSKNTNDIIGRIIIPKYCAFPWIDEMDKENEIIIATDDNA